MSEKQTPRDGCVWTEERCAQFEKLESLLNSVSLLNHGSHFLDNVRQCIDMANDLRKWDMNSLEQSFVSFLREQIIEDRFPKGRAQVWPLDIAQTELDE